MRRDIPLRAITGHVVREDASRNPIPEGKGLAVIVPSTQEVFMVKRSQVAHLQSWIAGRRRVGRGRDIRKGGPQ